MQALALVAFSTDTLFLGQLAHPPAILSGKVPLGHPSHSVAPGMLPEPSGHSTHPLIDVMLTLLEYLPEGQFRHISNAAALKIPENVPVGHGRHVVDPELGPYDPGLHGLHDVGNASPVDDSPGGQRVHRELPVELAKLPARHAVHTLADWFSANVPLSHKIQVVEPVPALYDPGLHGLHRFIPSELVNCPRVHATQTLLSAVPRLAFPYLPTAQKTHSVELGCVEYAPCGHPSHTNASGRNLTLYPALHKHPAITDPEGESEYGGQPKQDPADDKLYVLASHMEQTLDPAAANFPAEHQAQPRYEPTPLSEEYVPLGHLWHVLFWTAPLASEKVPDGHWLQLVLASSEDQVPAPHSRHSLDAIPVEYIPDGHAVHTDAEDREYHPVVQLRHIEAPDVGV